MQVVRDPEPDVLLAFLQGESRALNEGRGRLVQVVADCEVHYQGRATSTLHRGERLLLLKPDGTLLVHTAQKAKPVNWQPPGATFDARSEDGTVVLTAYRRKPEELVKVTFHTVHLLVATPLRDDAELALVGSEADLQRLLFENPQLVEDGFVPQRRERDSKRGFYDIDGQDREGRRLIVELKRTTAGVKEAQQLWRYVERLRGGKDPQETGQSASGDHDEAVVASDPSGGNGPAPPGPDPSGDGGPDGNKAPRSGRGAAPASAPAPTGGIAVTGTVRGILIAPRVADKARALLRDHGLEWKELDWTEIMPRVEAMKHSGQVGLGRFG